MKDRGSVDIVKDRGRVDIVKDRDSRFIKKLIPEVHPLRVQSFILKA